MATRISPYSEILTLVENLVRRAGPIVRTFHDRPTEVAYKGADDPVTEADRAVNAFLVSELSRAFPTDGILAEESQDDLARLERSHVWCIDPLDGTKEFIARNGEFSIMVGLAVDGVAQLGVVYQPILNFMYSGIRNEGAWLSTASGRGALKTSDTANPALVRLVVSRSHRNPITDVVKAELGIEAERISGSVGLKCGLIASNQADLYLHPAPGTKEWDTCAPEAILVGAGGMMTDCWGQSLRYNQPDVRRRRGLAASNGANHNLMIAALASVLDEAGIAGW